MPNLSITEIRRRRFWLQDRDFQREILQRGRPQPLLPNFFFLDTKYEPSIMLNFHPSQYDRFPWLTACENQNRLFCWPCLLLVEDNVWSTDDYPLLHEHERNFHHIQATLRLQLLMDELEILQQRSCSRLREVLVSRNMHLLRQIIDAINFMVLQKRLCQRRRADPITAKECIEAINLLSRQSTCNKDHTATEDAAFLLRNEPKFLTHLVTAISNVLKFSIKKEAHCSQFVSVVLTGHRRVSDADILWSTVLRFVKDGKVQERCIGFFREKCRDRAKFLLYLHKIVANYQLGRRLIAIAVDGFYPLSCVHVLNQDIVSKYPQAMFMHCPYSFPLYWDEMMKILSSINTVGLFQGNIFFGVMESMVSFLTEHHDDFNSCPIFNTGFADDKSSKSPLVFEWLLQNLVMLIKYFNHSSADNKWKEEDLNRVRMFESYLSQFETVFWLLFFIRLYNLFSDVYKTLGSSNPKTPPAILSMIISSITTEMDTGFNQFWNNVHKYVTHNWPIENIPHYFDARSEYCRRFCDVLYCIKSYTRDRLGHQQSLSNFKLFDLSNFTCPRQVMSYLVRRYSSIFSVDHLERESKILQKDSRALLSFFNEQMLEYMTRDESRRNSLPNTIRLTELVLSLPCVEHSGRPLIHRVMALTSSLKSSKPPNISVLYVENELLEEVRLRETFHDDVISVFGQIEKDTGMLLS